MSNILRAKRNPPFKWYYGWIATNEDGSLDTKSQDGLKQPDTIKVLLDVAETGVNSRGRTRQVTCDIVPDKAFYGPEFSLIFTIPQFKDKIWSKLDTKASDYVAQLHTLFGQCLQGKAASHWAAVLLNYPVPDRTVESFKEAQKDYLEKVAVITKLGDVIIRQLEFTKKPASLPLEEYLARRLEWQGHITNGYLRYTLAVPTKHQIAEQIFSHQPKHHQDHYARKHEEVEEDPQALKVYFQGCHDEDV